MRRRFRDSQHVLLELYSPRSHQLADRTAYCLADGNLDGRGTGDQRVELQRLTNRKNFFVFQLLTCELQMHFARRWWRCRHMVNRPLPVKGVFSLRVLLPTDRLCLRWDFE